jgi:hypothetical protein
MRSTFADGKRESGQGKNVRMCSRLALEARCSDEGFGNGRTTTNYFCLPTFSDRPRPSSPVMNSSLSADVTDYAGGRQAAHLSVFGPITGTSTPAEAFPEHLRKEGGTAKAFVKPLGSLAVVLFSSRD